MESLENALARVETLKRDLSAVIVIQEEEGEWHPRSNGSRDGTHYQEYEDMWCVTRPGITEPDMEKRERTKTQLKQIYETSEWYSVKYVVIKASDDYYIHTGTPIIKDPPKELLNPAVTNLEKNLRTTKIEMRVTDVSWTDHVTFNVSRYSDMYNDEHVDVTEDQEVSVIVLDREKIINIIDDTVNLFSFSHSSELKQLLVKIYNSKREFFVSTTEEYRQDEYNPSDDKKINYHRLLPQIRKEHTKIINEVRAKSGKLLGYSSLKIGLHQFYHSIYDIL